MRTLFQLSSKYEFRVRRRDDQERRRGEYNGSLIIDEEKMNASLPLWSVLLQKLPLLRNHQSTSPPNTFRCNNHISQPPPHHHETHLALCLRSLTTRLANIAVIDRGARRGRAGREREKEEMRSQRTRRIVAMMARKGRGGNNKDWGMMRRMNRRTETET